MRINTSRLSARLSLVASLVAVSFLQFPAFAQDAAKTAISYDFESGSQGWGPRGTVSVATSAAAARSGSKGLAASGRGEAWSGPSIAMAGTLKRGAVYSFEGYLRLASAPAAPSAVKFTMEEKAGGKTEWKTVAQANAADDKWIKMSGSYSFTGALDSLSLYAESSSTSDVIYIDDVVITMTAPPPAAAPASIEKTIGSAKDSFLGYFTLGVAVSPSTLQGLTGDLVHQHFNSVVAENAMKSLYIHPAEDRYFWDDADAIVKWARATLMSVRYHTLVWHSQVAPWFFIDKDGKDMTLETDPAKRAANKRLLLQRLTDHVTTIVSRYKDDIKSWDVVNEVVDPSGPGGLRDSPWYQIAGKDYIETAFRAARAAGGPKIKLYINDYGTDDPKKRDILFKLVKELLDKGVPIDGVGHQTHINIAQPPLNQIADSINLFAGIGLDNQITELDMSVYTDDLTSYASVSADLLARQGYRYKELFDLFKSLRGKISNVTLWGLVDSGSWLQDRPIKRADAPLLFAGDLKAKPAYYGLVDPSKLPPKPAGPAPKAEPKLGQAIFGTPKVDGIIEAAWDKAPVMDVSVLAAGNSAATAKGRAMWDADFLYVLMEVNDPVLNAASVNPYERDSVEAFLDENDQKTASYQGDDAQDRVSFANEQSFGSQGADKRFQSAAVQTKTGYIVEMAIPFRTIKGAEGKVVGFDLQVNDADSSGKRVGISKWNDASNESWRNTVDWGNLKLVK